MLSITLTCVMGPGFVQWCKAGLCTLTCVMGPGFVQWCKAGLCTLTCVMGPGFVQWCKAGLRFSFGELVASPSCIKSLALLHLEKSQLQSNMKLSNIPGSTFGFYILFHRLVNKSIYSYANAIFVKTFCFKNAHLTRSSFSGTISLC